jgi:menaquinone-dependent protoporphyrinogen oxidase
MARILIVYRSTHGQTAKIAEAIAASLRARGAAVDVRDAGAAHPHPEGYDAVIVAASVHVGKYQQPVVRWVQSHRAVLSTKPTAFVSVCLAVLQRDPKVQRAVADIVERFTTATAWQPTITKHIAGALLYTKYNWLIRFLMKRIAKKAGGDTDTTRDFEYTDWADLRSFAMEFGELVERSLAAEHPAAARAAG